MMLGTGADSGEGVGRAVESAGATFSTHLVMELRDQPVFKPPAVEGAEQIPGRRIRGHPYAGRFRPRPGSGSRPAFWR